MAQYTTHRLYSLKEMFQQHTVVELKGYLKYLSLRIKSGLKKDFMVEALTQWILHHPNEVIDQLLTYELRMYDDIINHPEKNLLIPRYLARLPFDDLTISDNYLPVSYVAPDLAEKLKPLLADAIARREESGAEKLENHIIGLINLRGFIDYNEYADIMEPAMNDSLLPVAYRFSHFTAGNNVNDELIVESPFVTGTDFNPFDYRCVDIDTKPKTFTADEIAKAAVMPYPVIGGAARDALKRQLVTSGMSEIYAERFIFDRWISKQMDSMNPLDGLDSLHLDSFEKLQELLPCLTDYANRVPFWKFKGWSSEEIAARRPRLKPGEKPRIVMGPNMMARGITSFDQLQEMAGMEQDLSDLLSPDAKKIGRNDRCPCGSGKKYKHCCGK